MYITRMLWDVACHAVGMKHESEFPVLLVMQEHLQIVQDFVWKRKKHEGGDNICCTLWASSAVTKQISFIWQLRIISWSLIRCNKEATVSAFFFTLGFLKAQMHNKQSFLLCIQTTFNFDYFIQNAVQIDAGQWGCFGGESTLSWPRGSSHMAWVWLLLMGEGVFSFNTSSEPISRSGTEWIQLSSINLLVTENNTLWSHGIQ